MTQSEYAAKVTTLIDEQTSEIDYPSSFDADIDACFQKQMTPEAAAEKLLREYTE